MLHHRNSGAQGETRTLKIWLLRPTRIPIPSPGQMLSLRRGNYRASEIWSGFTPINLSSRTPSTHSSRKELSCCQRWLGRPHLVCLLRQLSMLSNLIEKNHTIKDNLISFPPCQSSSCDAAWFGSGTWIRTKDGNGL